MGGKEYLAECINRALPLFYTSSIASSLLDYTSSYLFSLLLLDTTSKGEL